MKMGGFGESVTGKEKKKVNLELSLRELKISYLQKVCKFRFSLRTIMNVKSDISIHRSTTVCVYFWGFRLPIKNWDTWILHFEKVINFAILLNLYVQCEELSKVSICFRLPLCPCHSRQNILFQ